MKKVIFRVASLNGYQLHIASLDAIPDFFFLALYQFWIGESLVSMHWCYEVKKINVCVVCEKCSGLFWHPLPVLMTGDGGCVRKSVCAAGLHLVCTGAPDLSQSTDPSVKRLSTESSGTVHAHFTHIYFQKHTIRCIWTVCFFSF